MCNIGLVNTINEVNTNVYRLLNNNAHLVPWKTTIIPHFNNHTTAHSETIGHETRYKFNLNNDFSSVTAVTQKTTI